MLEKTSDRDKDGTTKLQQDENFLLLVREEKREPKFQKEINLNVERHEGKERVIPSDQP